MTSAIVSTKELAALFNVTMPTLRNWQKDGMPKLGKDKWNVSDCIEWKIHHEINQKTAHLIGSEVTTSELEIRKQYAETQLKELDLAERRGKLVAHDAIRKELISYLARLTTPIKQISSSWPLEILGIETKEQAQIILERKVNDLLEQLHNEPMLPDFSELTKIEKRLEDDRGDE